MKNFLLASSALITIAGAQAARAADVSPAPQLPAEAPAVTAAIYNWTGCYIGAHGGGGAVNEPFVAGGNLSNGNFLHGGGGFAGGQIGCNVQDGIMVLGLEGEGWSGLTNSEHFTQFGFFTSDIDRNRWGADVAVRAGLAFDRALVYGKAGIAEGRFAFSFTDSFGDSENGASTLTGTLLGVGLEYGLAPNWSAKLEYDHIEYAGRTVHFEIVPPSPLDQTEVASTDLVKAGIDYRFGGPSLPLASDGASASALITKAFPAKASAPAAFSRLNSWTGCYAGAHGGGGWMNDSFVGGDRIGGGGFAGGQLGCNVQAGAIVWGVEGEAAWSGLTDHFHSDEGRVFSDATTRNRWSADVAARAGIAVDRALVYGKAGLAAGRLAFSFTLDPEVVNGSTTLAGLLLGAGIEYAVAPNWSVKLEYNRVDYFGRNVGLDNTVAGPELISEAATANVIKLGVNYRFADLPFAPAADRAATETAILKAPVYKAPVAASTWTGCYAGVHGGGGVLGDTFTGEGRSDENPVPLSSGGFAGGQLGCDVQDGALVFGLQGEAASAHIVNAQNVSIPSQDLSLKTSSSLVWSADGAARAGVAIDRGLVYAKAGVAAGRFDFSVTDNFLIHGSTTLAGLLIGGGIEYALAPNWSVLLEYDRIAYAGRVVHFDTTLIPPFNETEAATVNEAKAGINYRFGGAALPPAASASQHLLPPPRYDWTGCYAGLHAGGGVIDDTFGTSNNSGGGGGAVAGGQVGCNVQTGIMVFGLEGEGAWSGIVNRFSDTNGAIEASDRHLWSADAAVRAGIAFDRALLYGKVGVAEGRFDFFEAENGTPVFNGGANLTGLLLGLGMEYAFAPNWSAKLEYDHIGYLSRNVDLMGTNSDESATTNIVKAGINYKFFGPSGAIAARD